MGVSIEGLQEAQADMEARIQALRPGGAFSRAVWYGLQAAFRHVLQITHVWVYYGGGLRASHRMQYQEAPPRGIISIDEGAVNPRGQRPAVYGPAEHARGGEHAFYQRTEDEAGPGIIRDVERLLKDEMKV